MSLVARGLGLGAALGAIVAAGYTLDAFVPPPVPPIVIGPGGDSGATVKGIEYRGQNRRRHKREELALIFGRGFL